MESKLDGNLESVGVAPDGSGYATISMPLPKDHWLTQPGHNVPPMPLRMGIDDPRRVKFAEAIREAGKYAYRCASMNGSETDVDPDALLQNLVVAMLGYWTKSGLSGDDWANPKESGALLSELKT